MDEIFASLERGAALLTSSRRLARELRRDFAAWQRDRGRTFWPSPSILPLDAYVSRPWTDWIETRGADVVLLSAPQCSVLWREIIRESPEGESLLNVEATAARAIDAWRLIHEYRVPLDGRFTATEDGEAFLGWAREFERICARKGWIDPARLADFISERVRSGEIDRPTVAWHAGFDQLSPCKRDFVNVIGAREWQRAPMRAVTRTRVCATAEDEIRCAAAWARRALEEDSAARVGVVVLSLAQMRSKVERIFRDELQPGAAPDSESAFHISLGQPLDRYPLIHAALLILDFAAAPLPLGKAGALLRTPFVGGAAEEREQRAAVDARFRRSGAREISADALRAQAGAECRMLRRLMRTFSEELAQIPAEQSHAAWSRTFSALLSALRWPGDRALDSHEHQLLRRWSELLSQFATVDAVSGPLPCAQAVARLRSLAARAVFQYEDAGAPIQICDPDDAAGLRFDRVWVMGLHDEAMPPAADPNPFIPISLHREFGLPGATAERQHAEARRVFERLVSMAPEVVLSFPAMEGDRALAPSPFLTANPQAVMAEPNAWVSRIRASSELEMIIDEAAPPLAPSASGDDFQRGGARLLADMAACPFRAFAAHRLHLEELERIEAGLAPRDKGKALHEALQGVWSELRSYQALRGLCQEDLIGLVRRHVDAALERYGETTNAEVEHVRLERLLTAWLKLERARPPFVVSTLEEKRVIELAGLRLQIRADRVDELPDGRRMILDYKTGDVKSKGWSGERLDEPQLPLYCITSDAPIAAAAFARIQAQGIGFSGIAETELPDFKAYMGKDELPLVDQLREWRAALSALAERFRAGDARVDPKTAKTCEYCAMVPLCRIREREDV